MKQSRTIPRAGGVKSEISARPPSAICMHLTRCNPIHPRLRSVLLLRGFHAPRAHLRKISDHLQIEPTTAKAKGLPSLKSNGRKNRKLSEGKRKERKGKREERLSSPTKLSSLLRLHDKSARYPRTVEGADGLKSRTLPGQLRASEKNGGLLYPLYVVSFHLLPRTGSF